MPCLWDSHLLIRWREESDLQAYEFSASFDDRLDRVHYAIEKSYRTAVKILIRAARDNPPADFASVAELGRWLCRIVDHVFEMDEAKSLWFGQSTEFLDRFLCQEELGPATLAIPPSRIPVIRTGLAAIELLKAIEAERTAAKKGSLKGDPEPLSKEPFQAVHDWTEPEKPSDEIDGQQKWTKPYPPGDWATVFSCSHSTLKRRIKDGHIRCHQVTSKKWQIMLADLPEGSRDKYPASKKIPARTPKRQRKSKKPARRK